MAGTLLEQLGGMRFIRSMVPDMYERVLADDILSPFFVGTDQLALTHKMTRFLGIALGDVRHLQSMNLYTAHHKLVAMGLDDQHFDAFVQHLCDVLQERDVDNAVITAATRQLNTLRQQVLCR